MPKTYTPEGTAETMQEKETRQQIIRLYEYNGSLEPGGIAFFKPEEVASHIQADANLVSRVMDTMEEKRMIQRLSGGMYTLHPKHLWRE